MGHWFFSENLFSPPAHPSSYFMTGLQGCMNILQRQKCPQSSKIQNWNKCWLIFSNNSVYDIFWRNWGTWHVFTMQDCMCKLCWQCSFVPLRETLYPLNRHCNSFLVYRRINLLSFNSFTSDNKRTWKTFLPGLLSCSMCWKWTFIRFSFAFCFLWVTALRCASDFLMW